MASKLTAEFIGTFWLVLGGCGSAVLAAAFPDVGIGLLGVSLAFGLTVLIWRVRARPDLGRPFQPRCLGRFVRRRAISRRTAVALHGGASDRRPVRRRRALLDRERKPELQP